MRMRETEAIITKKLCSLIGEREDAHRKRQIHNYVIKFMVGISIFVEFCHFRFLQPKESVKPLLLLILWNNMIEAFLMRKVWNAYFQKKQEGVSEFVIFEAHVVKE